MIAWQECWLSTPVSCGHMNRNGIVHLFYWNIKISSLLGVLSSLIFILCGFFPMVLMSILAFLSPPMGLHDKNVDCPHLYHVITWTEMWIIHLDCWSIKMCSLLEVLSAFILILLGFVLWCFCPFWLISVRPCDRITRMLIVHTCIMWSYEQKLDCTNWLFEYIYLNILSFGGFVPFEFYPLGILSCSAFVCFGFSLFANRIAWRECWLSTLVSRDHMNRNGIEHLDCWSIKIFSFLGVLSALIFILYCFCPMVLFSILAFLCPLTGSHDKNVDFPHLYQVIIWTEMGSYTLIVGVLKYFLFWGFCPLWFLSLGAFLLWCFCQF